MSQRRSAQFMNGSVREHCEGFCMRKLGATGGFGPDFYLKHCIATELRMDYRWQKWEQ